MDSSVILKEIAGQVSVCTRCNLHLTRKNGVPGEGPVHSEIMLIGEGPGFYENEQGRPFVGAAGKFLDELLQKANFKRDEVYITNVVKCRPPGNRDPLPEELEACRFYLEKQMEMIDPLVFITLGRFSMAYFIPNVRISAVHGQPRWVNNKLVVPMYHPAAALHQPALRSTLLEDFARLPEWVDNARKMKTAVQVSQPDPQTPQEPNQDGTGDRSNPIQLNLF